LCFPFYNNTYSHHTWIRATRSICKYSNCHNYSLPFFFLICFPLAIPPLVGADFLLIISFSSTFVYSGKLISFSLFFKSVATVLLDQPVLSATVLIVSPLFKNSFACLKTLFFLSINLSPFSNIAKKY